MRENEFEKLKQLNLRFFIYCAGLVLSILSIYRSFNAEISIIYISGWFLLFCTLELRKTIIYIKGDDFLKTQKKLRYMDFFLSLIGMALIIASLVDVLNTHYLIQFAIGLGILTFSLNGDFRKSNKVKSDIKEK